MYLYKARRARFPFSSMFLAAILLSASPLTSQSPDAPQTTFAGDARVTAVGVVVSASNLTGAAPPTLAASDLALREGETAPPVLSIVPVGTGEKAEPWRVVLYIDRNLVSPAQLGAVVLSLGEQLPALIALGGIEIWTADASAESWLAASRDQEVITNALARLLLEVEAEDEVATLRRGVLEALAGDSKEKGANDMPGVQLVAGAVEEERLIVERAQDALLSWVAGQPGGSPRLLLLVGSGYDLDPTAFYRARAGASAAGLPPASLAASTQRFAETLAAYGWVVCPLDYTEAAAGPSSTNRQFQQFRNTGLFGNQQQAAPVVGGTVQLGGRRGKEAKAEPMLLAPQVPQGLLAAESGGQMISKVEELPALLKGLGQRHYVTFQMDRALDGRLRPLSLAAGRAGLRVSGPKWVRSSTPEAVTETRVRRIVAGETELGELALAARLAKATEPGRPRSLTVRLDLGASAAFGPAAERSTIRLTVASGEEGGSPRFRHLLIEGANLTAASWTRELAVELSDRDDWLVVMVEDLATGAWAARDLAP